MSAVYGSRALPVREPDYSSSSVMTKRAWWLVLLNFVIPGSAQVLAGNRRLGRFGLGATIVVWVLALAAVVIALFAPSFGVSILANSWRLLAAQFVLAFYAVLWVILTLDTLRLTRLIRAAPAARPLVAALAVVLLVVTAGTASYGAFTAGIARGVLEQVFSGGGQVAEPINGRYNVLLLGGDAGPDRTGLRPDSISVMSVDAATGAATTIGIPRNLQRVPFVKGSPLYGPFPHGYDCGVNCLVNFLYTYGQEHPRLYPDAVKKGSTPGVEATRDAIEGVLGIRLQYYVLIDMQGFSDLIDSLGGVTIDVKEKLPIGGGMDANGNPTGTDKFIYPGVQHMNGYIAQWYSRARHGTSDYDRMARQKDVQAAVLAQFQPSTVLTKFEAVAKAGTQVVKTDVPQGMLARFVDLAGKTRTHPLARLDLVPTNGVNVVEPDFVAIHARVAKALAPISASSSSR